MSNLNIKARLSAMNFLEFAVWGAYLISMGMFLGSNGLGQYVFWFYTVQGLVSILMPALIGIVADRWIPAQITLSLCHILAGGFMIAAGLVSAAEIASVGTLSFGNVFLLYTLSVAFYMPTIGLSNSVAFNGLEKNGMNTVSDFPPIRVFGTVGFIVAEVAVNFISVDGITIQHSHYQFILSGILSLVLAAYCFTLPACPVRKAGHSSLAEALGLKAFKLFKRREMAIFFIFSMLLGVSLQITNSYGSSYIDLFAHIPGFTEDFWAKNPTFLISISQAAEAVCILLIPFFLKRYGIKGVMLIAMFAWVMRFGFFGIGDTHNGGVVFLILSCIVYGVAFDFFNVSGGIYVDSQTEKSQRSSAQGLFMLMTNGIGASIGTFLAGTFVVNKLVMAPGLSPMEQLDGWRTSWFIFAFYALVVAVMFMLLFRNPSASQKAKEEAELIQEQQDNADPAGFTEVK